LEELLTLNQKVVGSFPTRPTFLNSFTIIPSFVENTMKITEIVKDTTAYFSYLRNGLMYYDVKTNDGEFVCTFPVGISNSDDIGTATFSYQHKAITLMRYIRKAIESETICFTKVGESHEQK
jgi:hypothetical protein